MNDSEKKYESGVVLLSGGLDSAVCLSVADRDCRIVHPLTFDYHQRTASRELDCARKLAQRYGTRALRVVNLDFLREITGAALCSGDQTVTAKNEYVPFRNGIFLAIATALAETVGAEVIYIGSTGTDTICNDNSQAFRDPLEKAINIGTNTPKHISISAPIGTLDKESIVRLGIALGTRFEDTWSCHNNIDEACGACSNCISRSTAFGLVGIEDPALKK
jgi:7-cyano-7-deazaguanine synthase